MDRRRGGSIASVELHRGANFLDNSAPKVILGRLFVDFVAAWVIFEGLGDGVDIMSTFARLSVFFMVTFD